MAWAVTREIVFDAADQLTKTCTPLTVRRVAEMIGQRNHLAIAAELRAWHRQHLSSGADLGDLGFDEDPSRDLAAAQDPVDRGAGIVLPLVLGHVLLEAGMDELCSALAVVLQRTVRPVVLRVAGAAVLLTDEQAVWLSDHLERVRHRKPRSLIATTLWDRYDQTSMIARLWPSAKPTAAGPVPAKPIC